ncbi:MAG: hypothetical protein KGL39_26750, partial [Patescibacteria group bacterium]|nr:hypothetical protein [Patescibacteria group bacterium]
METTPGVPFSFDLGTSPVVAAYHVVDDGFTPQELNAFAEGHRARRLVWLLLVTPKHLYACRVAGEVREVPGNLSPVAVTNEAFMREHGFEFARVAR